MDFIKSTYDMNTKKIYAENNTLVKYLLAGAIIGALVGCLEYVVRIKTNDDPQEFYPLMVRAMITGSLIIGSVLIFELFFKNRFMQRPFLYLVLVRSLFYTLIITLWLFIINGIWFAISEVSFQAKLFDYILDEMYLINLFTGFSIVLLAVGLNEINSLHRRGELINFVLGKYHTPREVDRIFCFIDLKDSTSIAEKLGHYKFAMFLKEYYSDITEALRKTNAQIYQYVGDEIVLSWSYKNGLKNNNLINCFFQMKVIIKNLKQKYMNNYGIYPDFKAGIHGGQVIVTWVGEMKKEIVYIGDVLNTAARIQEQCKRLGKDFLISGELLNSINGLGKINASFIENTFLRGKEKQVKLYCLEKTR